MRLLRVFTFITLVVSLMMGAIYSIEQSEEGDTEIVARN